MEPDELTLRLERRTGRRSAFAVHSAMYLGYMVYSVIFLLDPDFWRFMTLPNTGDIVLMLMVWTVIFIAHGARFRVQEAGDQQVQAVYDTLVQPEKVKRDRLVLQDDGEVLWVDQADNERRKRLNDTGNL